MASSNWLSLQCTYKYYEFLYLKWKSVQYWKSLSNKSKSWFILSAICATTGLGHMVYQYLLSKEKEYYVLMEKDFCETQVISKRRKRGLPPGLFNEGNYCYANSTLQAMASCDSFCEWIQKVSLLTSDAELTLIPSLYKILKVLNNVCGNEDSYSLGDLFNSLTSHGWSISSDQQDAYEMLQIILSTVSEEWLKVHPSGNQSYNSLFQSLSTELFDTNESILKRSSKFMQFSHTIEKYQSPFNLSFANKMICLTCGYQRAIKFDVGDGMILNLQDMNPVYGSSLDLCLQKWNSPELIQNVSCEECSAKSNENRYSTFTKQISFSKLPLCLCIELQRTYYTNTGYVVKNSTHVQFTEILNLQKYTFLNNMMTQQKKRSIMKNKIYEEAKLSGSMTIQLANTPAPMLGGKKIASEVTRSSDHAFRSTYKLMSVVVHYGNANDGHFICYRRFNKHWLRTSDQCVTIVSLTEVLACNAYLLFYEKLLE